MVRITATLLGLICLLSVERAFAQSTVEGWVIAIESGDIVVDVAKKQGAAAGDTVELWRPLTLKHPVTGKKVTDRFRIGTLELTQVRDALAFARPKGKLERPPEPGDIVVLTKAPEPTTAPMPTVVPEATPSGEGLDAEAAQVTRMFEALKNQDVPKRVAAYETYVRNSPDSRFAAVLYEEAQALRKLLALQANADQESSPAIAEFEPPREALAGQPFAIGVELTGDVSGAVLHARHSAEVAYQSTPMRSAGPGYWVATIPGARMRAPELQYFVEAIATNGRPSAVVGDADNPKSLEVNRIPEAKPLPRSEATVSVLTDYADYNRLEGNDRVWQTEGWVGMRFADEGVRALRTGFGVYRGVGGSLEELDEQNKSGRKVGLTYGYLEGEYAFTSFTALIVRGVIGLEDHGVSGGAQALVRIGNDKRTNLMLGGEVLGGIGLRGITELQLNTFERVPIVLRTEVTNQPAGSSADPTDVRPEDPAAPPEETSLEKGEIGARAIAQIGYELFPGFVAAVRGSYQGRTINHAGPGVGGAVMYTW